MRAFVETLKDIRDGDLLAELPRKLQEVIEAVQATNKKGKLDVKRRIIAGAKKNDQTGDRRKEGFNERWDAAERKMAQPSGPNPIQSLAKREGRHEPVYDVNGRNKRSVWTVPTQPYPDAHFATFPESLIEPCILAGSRPGDTVLDPFTGSGTTGAVAVRHQRSFVGTELNPDYIALARKRIGAVSPLFASEAAS